MPGFSIIRVVEIGSSLNYRIQIDNNSRKSLFVPSLNLFVEVLAMSALILTSCVLVLLATTISSSTKNYFIIVNVLSFATVALDKFKSIVQYYRIREVDMHIQFLFGGWIGGALAMFIFRHKTRKTTFLTTMVFVSLVNIVVVLKMLGKF